MKKVKRIGNISLMIIVSLLAMIIIFPIAYTTLQSFSSSESSFNIIPDSFSLDGYFEVFVRSSDYLYKFWVSFILATGITVGQVFVSTLAAFGFSRFRFYGKNILFFLVIITMMMPYQVTIVSSYITLDKMSLLGTYWALLLPGIFSSFGVFLLKQSFDGFPEECAEAARLDGASYLQILYKIIIPQNRSAIAALVVLGFVDAWNMVEQPLILLKYPYQYPLSVFLSQMNIAQTNALCAAGVLSAVPVLLLFLFYDKDLMEGMKSGIY